RADTGKTGTDDQDIDVLWLHGVLQVNPFQVLVRVVARANPVVSLSNHGDAPAAVLRQAQDEGGERGWAPWRAHSVPWCGQGQYLYGSTLGARLCRSPPVHTPSSAVRWNRETRGRDACVGVFARYSCWPVASWRWQRRRWQRRRWLSRSPKPRTWRCWAATICRRAAPTSRRSIAKAADGLPTSATTV